jgi:hypothetical protein
MGSEVVGFDENYSKQYGSMSGGKRKRKSKGKKGNGHKDTCACPICKNMMKKGKKGGVLLVGGTLPEAAKKLREAADALENKEEEKEEEKDEDGDTGTDTDTGMDVDEMDGGRRRSSKKGKGKKSKKGGKSYYYGGKRSKKAGVSYYHGGNKSKKRGRKSRRY